MEEKRTEKRRTKETEEKAKVTAKERLQKRNAWKNCPKESGDRSVREFSRSKSKLRTSRTFSRERLRGKPRWTLRRTKVLLPIEGRYQWCMGGRLL